MQNHFDVIVAGVGSMGSATCYHLARKGASVLGLEQFSTPHARGSHHGHSRMIRQAYFEHPDYVPLLKRAYQLWDELQENQNADHPDSPQSDFFFRTGGLYLGKGDGTIVPGSLASAKEHDLEFDLFEHGDVLKRYPQIWIPDDHVGFFEREAGFLIPELAVATHAAQAKRHDATIHTEEVLQSWNAGSRGVTVNTNRHTYTSDHLVITSGAWTSEIASQLGIPLQVTRQVLAWFEADGDPQRFAPDRFPCWFIETDPPFGHYGFPMRPGDPGLKIALHKPGNPIAPDGIGNEIQPPTSEEIESLHQILHRYFPNSVKGLAKTCTCLYTNSPDGHFILGSHPKTERVSIACGFSGHGFKFASVIGEALADLATAGATDLPVGFLSPERFS